MKNFIPALALALLLASNAYAVPTLQLDIAGGTYNTSTKTISASDNSFTLYAYLVADSKNKITDTYFVSAALIPKQGNTVPKLDFGSFDYGSGGPMTTIKVTQGMLYGNPPIEANLSHDGGDLGRHGIFPTYFNEFGFKFSSTNQISEYNTQDRATEGESIPKSGSGMYYKAFTFDMSKLDVGYGIHFDLYNETSRTKSSNDIDITAFAPFSHDAEGWRQDDPPPVPEPGTMILFAAGVAVIGIARIGKRRISKNA